jgi:two-component system sensor histidine kinase YesM
MRFTNPSTQEKELLSAHRSELTDWTTLMIVSEKQLLEPLASFTRRTVPVALIILMFAIVLSFIAAKRITLSILKIHKLIRSIRLKDLGIGNEAASRELNSGVTELDQLHWSFVKMSVRLKESMDELLLSQSQEIQAKLVALQSQMNPHFLYNTLATISVMAEENMNREIVAMSENMSDFLRYISSERSYVPLETELLHTEKYLEINQIRHGDKLCYSFEIDERLFLLKVPKLIIQPLVENALKFGTKKEPPWIIRIYGETKGGCWKITVSDNGPGFNEESFKHLFARIREMDETKILPALQLDGMGLLNIYIRLQLSYGEQALFTIAKNAGGGTDVTIGGPILAMND